VPTDVDPKVNSPFSSNLSVNSFYKFEVSPLPKVLWVTASFST
jgi:hypothetical protein